MGSLSALIVVHLLRPHSFQGCPVSQRCWQRGADERPSTRPRPGGRKRPRRPSGTGIRPGSARRSRGSGRAGNVGDPERDARSRVAGVGPESGSRVVCIQHYPPPPPPPQWHSLKRGRHSLKDAVAGLVGIPATGMAWLLIPRRQPSPPCLASICRSAFASVAGRTGWGAACVGTTPSRRGDERGSGRARSHAGGTGPRDAGRR